MAPRRSPGRRRRRRLVAAALLLTTTTTSAYDPGLESGDAARARMFDRPACRAAIAEAWERVDWQSTSPVWFAQEVVDVNLNGHPLHIVRNQKVASTYIWENPPHEVLGVTPQTLFGEVNKTKSYYANPPSYPASDIVVTFARNPREHLLSGYAEIVLRNDSRQGNFWKMTCDSEANKYAKFKQFLLELERGLHLGSQTFHVWPQALLVDAVAPRRVVAKNAGSEYFDLQNNVASVLNSTLADDAHPGDDVPIKRYDYIGDLSTLEDVFDNVRRDALVQPHQRQKKGNVPKKRHSHNNIAGCNLDHMPIGEMNYADQETTRRFCDMFEVDYVCFFHPLPRPCVNLYPNYAQGTGKRSSPSARDASVGVSS
eukprot:CAMPEP_0198656912 /NCGR_PEP_ID=MMETSP1467-20131203/11201_1 /TAXON_ID=1462469 /ORGANISM="unid. sp., Strain CCMP2135" /LENGTH=369 /DNA_ID=CAMNT_0044392995 /DNA_START=208 /DNA_END=1317 /DNA_ORIENTATION=+